MAYLDVREPVAAFALPTILTPSSTAIETIGFAPHEWDVIQLARQDRLSSLSEPTRLGRVFAWVFGGDVNRRLADPRLEALRRLAVLAWHHGYAVPVSAIKSFNTAGYSVDQLELLLASIGTSRSSRSGRAFA